MIERFHCAGDRQIGLAGPGRPDAEIDVVPGDRLKIGRLVRTATTDRATLDPDRDRIGLGGSFSQFVDPGGVQSKIEGVGVQRLVLGLGVQRLQQPFGRRRDLAFADHAEQTAAIGDLDAQPGFDLAQMAVHRAAQVGEPEVVFGIEGEIALGQRRIHGQDAGRTGASSQFNRLSRHHSIGRGTAGGGQ